MKAECAALLLAAAIAGPASAENGWEVVGSRAVGISVDHDTIPVRGAERHRQVRLCAYGGGVVMIDLDIRFANGGRQDVPVRSLIRPNSCTRSIDLVGDNRNMTEIHAVYERARWRRSAGVRVEAR
ncbi:MAG: hypothetical protein ACXWUN_03465 [Allosphingosinicella sp.]